MEYLILTFLWVTWCFFHSILITPTVSVFFKKTILTKYKYIRLFYNLFALITFIAISMYKPFLQEEILFSWNGSQQFVQFIFLLTAIIFYVLGTKNYNMRQFLGISQLSQTNSNKGIGEDGKLNQSGILQITRHPWYVATFLLLWVGYIDLVYSRLLMNVVFSLYLIIGTILEERKLVDEFGDAYSSYQQKVPMFISLKSFRKK